MPRHNTSRFLPLVIAACICVGLLLGSFFANHFIGNRLSIINTSGGKLNDMLYIVNDQYVDEVDMNQIIEKVIPQMLGELDPHSTYVNAENVEKEMQDLKGHFSGIGVLFTIYDDTLHIVRVLEGGPSESVGIQAGDRIIAVDDKPFTGDSIDENYAMRTLKGPRDSKVKLQIRRRNVEQPLIFNLTRGDVPLSTIDAAYMLNDKTGYICLSSFGETTYAELLAALARLHQSGFTSLVIDLRNNHGGYMAPAVQMANEFLPKDRLIVYTEGRKVSRTDYRTDGRGSYQTIPIIVLVSENTASSSEIFAGAIQDNDRGYIVGRRTFGKGLVQEPISFSDGSMLRLTIARYYSPSGRCLQKPYANGKDENYDMDLLWRAEKGEYLSADSIHLEGNAFQTRLGRTVYGGGGVMPDFFVPADTLGVTSYLQEALYGGYVQRFAFDLIDNDRAQINALETQEAVVAYLRKQRLVERFAAFAEKRGLRRRNLMLHKSMKVFEEYIIAYALDDIFGKDSRMWFVNLNDPCVAKALELISQNNVTPLPPAQADTIATE